jgi:putative ABC transport system permease protein
MIVLSLGLAVGAATAVFSFVDVVLLRPLPYRDANSLVLLWGSKTKEIARGISNLDLQDLQANNQVFENVVPFVESTGTTLRLGREDSVRVKGLYVGREFFSVIGVHPYLGGGRGELEELPATEAVAVLSYDFWKTRFGRDSSVVGRTILLNDEPHRIVGVMPPEFFFPDQTVQVWLRITRQLIPPSRGTPFFHAIARLRLGGTFAAAQTDVDRVVSTLASAYPDTDKHLVVGVFSLLDQIVGNYRAAFWSLFGGVFLLLMIACANIAHLLLAQGMRRAAEMSVRMTLGATRQVIIRQLLTESLLVSSVGGVVGTLMAFGGVRVMLRLGLTDIPRFADASVDYRALLFALGASMLAGLSFGLLPAMRASTTNPVEDLKGGMSYSYGTRSRFRDILTVSEIALAFVLMSGAGLSINSFVRLARLNWGFRPDHLLIADAVPPQSTWYDISQNAAFAEQLIPRFQALPGVQSVTVARGSPIAGVVGGPSYVTADGKQRYAPRLEVAGPFYFRTLGIPILRGREFNEKDDGLAPKVAVVDKALAQQLWPGQDPVGKTLFVLSLKKEIDKKVASLLRLGKKSEAWGLAYAPESVEKIAYAVVGEVGPVLMYGPLPVDSSSIYIDYRQRPTGIPMLLESFFLRTSTEPTTLTKAVREIISTTSRGATIDQIDTLEERVQSAVGDRGSSKLLFVVSSITSAQALLLAVLGVYGVIGYTAVLRTHEIGVRIALGGQRARIFQMILGRGFLLIICGLLFGLAGTVATTKLLAGYLFGITPTDTLTLACAAGVLFLTACFACYLPARRAMLLDPVSALRHE